ATDVYGGKCERGAAASAVRGAQLREGSRDHLTRIIQLRGPEARFSIHPCRIKIAAMRSTAFPRFSIDKSASRNNLLASTDVSRSSHKCTGSRNLLRSSSANTCILSD